MFSAGLRAHCRPMRSSGYSTAATDRPCDRCVHEMLTRASSSPAVWWSVPDQRPHGSTDIGTIRSPEPARPAPSPRRRRPPPTASFAALQTHDSAQDYGPRPHCDRVGSCCAALPGQPGANNRPPETATAVSASDTLGSPNRPLTAAATAATAVVSARRSCAVTGNNNMLHPTGIPEIRRHLHNVSHAPITEI